MRRRAFILLIGSAAASPLWPLTSHSKQPTVPVIGFLHVGSPVSNRLAAFNKGLSETGYVEGRNVAIEYRWANDRLDRLLELATDLVRLRVSVIATPGGLDATLAAKHATATIPIVFGIPDDPVKFGLVASLARPGGNATGVNFLASELVPKRLELLRELVPRAARVAVLVNPTNASNAESTVRAVEAAGRTMGLQFQIFNASTSSGIDTVFTALARERPDALFVGPDSFFNARRLQLATLAAEVSIPAAYAGRDHAESGGLMIYGTDIARMFHDVGIYTGRVLKGEKPADLPVVQPTKLELVINLKTAKALGIEVPPALLARADEVIE